MDMLPPEIAEGIWKNYWGYEYRKNFIRSSMRKELYMNKIIWKPYNPVLFMAKENIQTRIHPFRPIYAVACCGYNKANGKPCHNEYYESVSKQGGKNFIHLKGNAKQVYNINCGFCEVDRVGWRDNRCEELQDLPEYVRPLVCGIHIKNFNLEKYLISLNYKMRNGYLCINKPWELL